MTTRFIRKHHAHALRPYVHYMVISYQDQQHNLAVETQFEIPSDPVAHFGNKVPKQRLFKESVRNTHVSKSELTLPPTKFSIHRHDASRYSCSW